MTEIMRSVLVPGPLFEVAEGWLPTAQQLDEAGLPCGPLAAVNLDVVQISAAGKWHVAPHATIAAGCPRVRRAAAEGRPFTCRRAGLLAVAGLGLCRACAARIRLSGRAGAYLDLARYIIAARVWTQALELAAREADWPACVRWTARTPFADENVLDLIEALGGDPAWQPAQQAATITWQELWDRADTAQARARVAAGPPGLRAHAAAACALVAAQQDTLMENELIGAISTRPHWLDFPQPAPGWGAAKRAWAAAICLDADLAAARRALTGAVEQLYAKAQVRDVALLPAVPACSGEEFCSLAEWANAEYRAVREVVTQRWCQRLEDALAEVQAESADATGRWRLLLIMGWPPADDRDQELAYLACYPELARTGPVPAPDRDWECWSRAIVVLHVPGFAARHAAAHHSPNLTATLGPVLPAWTQPSPDQVRALFRNAAAMIRAGRYLT